MNIRENDEVVTVDRRPFAVPGRYRVLRGSGFGAFGDIVTVELVAPAGAPADLSATFAAGAPAPTAAHPHTHSHTVPDALLLRRFGRVAASRRRFWLLMRSLALRRAIPLSLPNVQPLIDVYKSTQTPADLYCVYPSKEFTLADAIASAMPLELSQIVTITNELLLCLAALHSQGIVVTNLRPESIGIDPEMRTRNALTITDLSRCVHATEAAPFAVIDASDAESAAAGRATVGAFSSGFHATPAMMYEAPEIALRARDRVTPAADMWSVATIVAEMATRSALVPAASELQYARSVTDILGGRDADFAAFTQKPGVRAALAEHGGKRAVNLGVRLPGADRGILLLLSRLLQWDPAARLSAADALKLPLLSAMELPAEPAVGGAKPAGGPSPSAGAAKVMRANNAASFGAAESAGPGPAVPAGLSISAAWALPPGATEDELQRALHNTLGAGVAV
jgi:serine/threonine protein kinase